MVGVAGRSGGFRPGAGRKPGSTGIPKLVKHTAGGKKQPAAPAATKASARLFAAWTIAAAKQPAGTAGAAGSSGLDEEEKQAILEAQAHAKAAMDDAAKEAAAAASTSAQLATERLEEAAAEAEAEPEPEPEAEPEPEPTLNPNLVLMNED